MKVLQSYAVWQQRPSSSCIKGTDTSLPSFHSLVFADHSPPGSSQTSPGSSCNTGLMCPWLESGWSTAGSGVFLSLGRLNHCLPSLATKPNRRPLCYKPAAPMLPLAQPVLWRVSSKLMQPLGLSWLANSDAQVTENYFSVLKPMGLRAGKSYGDPPT